MKMTERNEQEGRERSPVVRAMNHLASYRELNDRDGAGCYQAMHDLDEIVQGYEQLQRAGHDVADELRERQYQVMEAALEEIECELENGLADAIKNRTSVSRHNFNLIWLQDAVDHLVEYAGRVFITED